MEDSCIQSRLPEQQTLFCKGSLKTSLDMTDPDDLVGHNHLPDVTEVSLAKARNTTGACWPGSRQRELVVGPCHPA
jgi:hypothetical protein